MSLHELREKIDELDVHILKTIQERMSKVNEVIAYKNTMGIPIYQPQRENEIYSRICNLSKETGLPADLMTEMWERIIESAHRIERKNCILPEHVAYLGPEGSFSHEAAQQVSKKLVACPSISAVVQSVLHSNSIGVMPYYNKLEGLVQESLDLIDKNELSIIDKLRVNVTFFAVQSGSPAAVYSHPKALAQCSNYLTEHYPHLPQIAVSSTSQAVQKILENGGIALCSLKAAQGQHVIATHIENEANNYTDFLLVAKNARLCEQSALSMIAISPEKDYAGLLRDIMEQMAFYGINAEKIHSRPQETKGQLGEPQTFYLEVQGNRDDDHLRRCVDALKWKFKKVKVLGSYG